MNLEYKQYLESREWRDRRAKVLEFYGSKCALCGNGKNLQVHHKNYKNIFKETTDDLIVLCRECHSRHHGIVEKSFKKRKEPKGTVSFAFGEDCPKCGHKMERRKHRRDKTKKGKVYRFTEWDFCTLCRYVQHYEKFKVHV